MIQGDGAPQSGRASTTHPKDDERDRASFRRKQDEIGRSVGDLPPHKGTECPPATALDVVPPHAGFSEDGSNLNIRV